MRGRYRNEAVLIRRLFTLAAAFLTGCTYSSEERIAKIEQIVRLGDSFSAIVVVSTDAFRRPTGLSTFPDGGKWKYTARGSAQYLLDARTRAVRLLARQDAPDALWESFNAGIVGLQGDSIAYVRLSGCPRGGECYPGLDKSAAFRLSVAGRVDHVDSVPATATLPGTMVARSPGELNYVRFGVASDAVTVLLEEGGVAEPLFRVQPDGSLVVGAN